MLELDCPFLSVALAFDADVWSHESNHLEVAAQFLCVPHLSIMGFECFPAAGFDVDLGESLASDGFSWIANRFVLP